MTRSKVEDFVGLSHVEQYRHAYEFMHVLCRELDIVPPVLNIGVSFYGSCYMADRKLIVLNTWQLDAEQVSPLMVLAHELRHAYQDQIGRMKHAVAPMANKDNDQIIFRMGGYVRHVILWDGEEVHGWESKKHHQLLWEIDAIWYEEKIAERLQVKPFPRPERDRERFENEKKRQELEQKMLENFFDHIRTSA